MGNLGGLVHVTSNSRDDDDDAIEAVLSAAGRYAILLDPAEPMTPTLVRDVERRQMQERWDRLAITANCCQYAVRLKAEKLCFKHSLSLSVLTLCLLNGEVLLNGNGQSGHKDASNLRVTEYLKENIFKGIYMVAQFHL